jgi:hypothetical protein
MIFLNTPADMQWLRETHFPHLPIWFHSAAMYGNEDAPTKIDAYFSTNPGRYDASKTTFYPRKR